SCVGTPLYMAPEVWSAIAATPRTDIYSLGAVIYELASGKPPHTATDYWSLRSAAINNDVRALAKLVPDIPPDFAAIVDRCLRRDPQQRFASGEELQAALESLHARTAERKLAARRRLSPRQRSFLWAGGSGTL